MNFKLKVIENPTHPNWDCSRCISQCKASCCHFCPLDPELYVRNEKKLQRKVKHLLPFGDMIIPITKDGYCPFLTKDYQCAIYDERPDICRLFGTECHPNMTCAYQAKDGRVRDKDEQEQVIKEIESYKPEWLK